MPARATAPTTCTRRCASHPSPAPGCNEGGGGFHNNGAIYHWNKTLIEGLDVADPKVRVLDQSRIGPVLTGDPADIKDGPPVTALFIQNTNPVQVAPEQRKVKAGFAREDLFVRVHEQFMTATAKMADVVLPATMFLEHDDVYQGGGHQNILLGPKLIEVPGECRSNHDVHHVRWPSASAPSIAASP